MKFRSLCTSRAVFIIMLSSCTISNAWLPYVVTKFTGIEQFYLDLSQVQSSVITGSLTTDRQPHLQSQSDIDAYTKWKICENIFVHNYRYYEHPFAVLIDPSQHQNYLLDKYPTTFDDIFVERLKKSILPGVHALNSLKIPSRPYWELVNPSRKRAISINGAKYNAYAFSCLVQEVESKVIRQYFVSRDEYNVNEAPGEDFMAGRFVFFFDANDESSIVVHALVEEFPNLTIFSLDEILVRYLTRKATHPVASSSENDPICSLDPGQKVRLCAAVFHNSQVWEKFAIAEGGECLRRRFIFPRFLHVRPFWDTRFRTAPTDEYEEWMIECVKIPSGSTRTFVSRSYHNNEVFVYTKREGNDLLFMARSAARVSVVRDEATNSRSRDETKEQREEESTNSNSQDSQALSSTN